MCKFGREQQEQGIKDQKRSIYWFPGCKPKAFSSRDLRPLPDGELDIRPIVDADMDESVVVVVAAIIEDSISIDVGMADDVDEWICYKNDKEK